MGKAVCRVLDTERFTYVLVPASLRDQSGKIGRQQRRSQREQPDEAKDNRLCANCCEEEQAHPYQPETDGNLLVFVDALGEETDRCGLKNSHHQPANHEGNADSYWAVVQRSLRVQREGSFKSRESKLRDEDQT